MDYLSRKAFVHRDLAARNILISEDKICKVELVNISDRGPEEMVPVFLQISDFGMSRDLMDTNYYVSHGGKVPVKWTAPEVRSVCLHGDRICDYINDIIPQQAIQYKKYSTASDVWSFGCVMYEIWSLGHKPFEAYSNVEVRRTLISTTSGPLVQFVAPLPNCYSIA